VQEICWYDMVKWCNARSEREYRTPAYYTEAAKTNVCRTGTNDLLNDWVKWTTGYRLPTEAEWEKAARGALSGKRFPWGDTISHSQANYYSTTNDAYDISPTRGHHPTYATGGTPYTAPVGSFAPNGYGVYDVTGNVWELCWDWYSNTYYSSSPAFDPRGPVPGSERVRRGGGWGNNSEAYNCRVAARISYGASALIARVGFRSVLAASQ